MIISPTLVGFFVCGTILCKFLYETPLAQMKENEMGFLSKLDKREIIAKRELGTISDIRDTFIGFQEYLYEW